MTLSRNARVMSGITILIVPTIMYGGWTLLGILTQGSVGHTMGAMRLNETQWALWRAGHAHAGVWTILCCVAAGSAGLDSALDRFNLAGSHLCANLGSSVFGSTLWSRVLRLIQYPVVPRCRIDADCSVDDRSGAIARRRR
jgi:hypothetical protein